MASNLYQLFRYARSEHADAKENFTTEALAMAIRYDHGPAVAALRNRGWLRGTGPVEVTAFTQVHVPGVGFIDLVLQIRDGARLDTFWIEVKVDAGEHGSQLTNYLAYIAANPGITLLTLGREPLRADIPHLTWREVRRCALAANGSPTWHDFALFLEEIGMADDYDEPLVTAEVGALMNAYALLRKLAHVLEPVGRHANELWPGSAWPDTADTIRRTLGGQLANHRRFTISNTVRSAPAWLVVGFVQPEATSPGMLQVALEARPKDLPTRAMLDALLRAKLHSAWSWPQGTWPVLLARAPTPVDHDLQGVSHWFNERLDELHAAGLFAKLQQLVATKGSTEADEPE